MLLWVDYEQLQVPISGLVVGQFIDFPEYTSQIDGLNFLFFSAMLGFGD